MKYICNDCGKELKSAGSLIYHQNRKNSCKNIYTCQKCAAEFNIQFHLKAHLLTCGFKDNYLVNENDLDNSDNSDNSDYIDYKNILKYVPDMIAHYNISGNITYVSEGCKQLLGYEPEEMINKSGYEFIYEEDIEFTKKEQQKMMQNKPSSYTYIMRRVCKDSTIKKILVNTNILYDSSGNIIGAITSERES